MRFLRMFRPVDDQLLNELDLDIPHVAAAGRVSPDAARRAIRILEDERKRLHRRLKIISRQLKRMTSGRVRDVGRSGPMMGSVQMRHDMQSMQEAGQNSGLALQEADTIARLEEVERLIDELKNLV
jgi:hypothetical protein